MENSQQVPVGEIFAAADILRVPDFQRGYAWEETHVQDLLHDVKYLLSAAEANREPSHYFGTIVLHEDDEGVWNVVDGQQRLLTTALLAVSLDSEIGVRPDSEVAFGLDRTTTVEPQQRDREMWERLVVDEIPPDSLTADSPSGERLLEAKRATDEWAREQLRGSQDGAGKILDTISEGLQCTLHTVDDYTEAGRIFETINDRGRDLTVSERIKSYLIFRCEQLGEQQLGRRVYETFGDVDAKISAVGSEADIETFLREHWRMFAGEPDAFGRDDKYASVPEKIKRDSTHASPQRDDEGVRKWIDAYLDSVNEVLSAFDYLRRAQRGEFDGPASSVERALLSNLRDLSVVGPEKSVLALELATLARFGVSEKTVQITDLLETFCFRAYQVARTRRDARRGTFRSAAVELYYTTRQKNTQKIFNKKNNQNYINDKKQMAFGQFTDINKEGKYNKHKKTYRKIEDAIGRYGSDEVFEKNLRRSDILSGSKNEEGWNGLRNRRQLLYLLFKFNKLEYNDNKFNIRDVKEKMVGLDQVWNRDLSVLTDEAAQNYRTSKDRLGNYVFLSAKQTPTESLPYELKYSRYYTGTDNPALVRQLPKPREGGWGRDEIDRRTDEIVEFALDYWDVQSGANVEVADINTDKMSTETVESRLREVVRENFDGGEMYAPDGLETLPKVTLNSREAYRTATTEQSCPACGEHRNVVKEREGVLSFNCVCGESLSRPLVSYHFDQF